jgi:hypothetical protein
MVQCCCRSGWCDKYDSSQDARFDSRIAALPRRFFIRGYFIFKPERDAGFAVLIPTPKSTGFVVCICCSLHFYLFTLLFVRSSNHSLYMASL